MRIEVLAGNTCDALFNSVANTDFIRLSCKKRNSWQMMKARFEEGDLDRGIRISKPVVTYGPTKVSSSKMAISFRLRHKKLIFQSYFDRNILTWPEQIIQTRRKLFERQHPPEHVTVQFWKTHDPSEIIHARLQDMSAGGLRVIAQGSNYEKGNYVCSIGVKNPLRLDAIIKSINHQQNYCTISFQFVGVDFDPIKQLNRIDKVLNRWNHDRGRCPAPVASSINQFQFCETSLSQHAVKSLATPRLAAKL